MTELVEMTQILSNMSTDTYMRCKYALLLSSSEHQETNAFFKKLFSLTDRHRPLGIGINGKDDERGVKHNV